MSATATSASGRFPAIAANEPSAKPVTFPTICMWRVHKELCAIMGPHDNPHGATGVSPTFVRRRVLVAFGTAVVLTLVLASTAGARELRPTPAQAPNDTEVLWRDGCFAWDWVTRPRTCVFGELDSTYKVALVGDSHTSDFFPAFHKLAIAHHWKLYTFVKSNCPFVDLRLRHVVGGKAYPECAIWNHNVLRRLQRLRPDLTVTVPFRWISPIDPSQNTARREGASIGRMLAQVSGRKIVIVDTPFSFRNVPQCLEAHSRAQCAIPKSQALSGGVRTRERKAAAVGGGTYLDLTSKICNGFPCRVVTDGILMFRDSHHLTATYTRSLAPMVDAALNRILHPTANAASLRSTSRFPL
jgi:hypothetical protein